MKQNVCYGLHAVKAFLSHSSSQCLYLAIQKGRDDKRIASIIEIAKGSKVEIQYTDKSQLAKLCKSEKHQGVVLVSQGEGPLPTCDVSDILCKNDTPFFLVLDEVTDPHNLGACLRSANAVGVDALIITKNRSASVNATVRKVACGAAEVTPVITVTNLARTLKELKDNGVFVIGAAGEAEQTAYQADLKGPLALVMGAEGKGMRRLTRENCDALVSLPMCGTVSSLNVSVATGVLLFEALRQRLS